MTGIVVSALTGLLLTTQPTSSLPLLPQVDTTSVHAAAEPRIQTFAYIVAEGDSLTTIAGKVYGKEDYWTTLWNDNPELVDPAKIEVGQRLTIRMVMPDKVEDLKPELASRLGYPAQTIVHPEYAYTYSVQSGSAVAATPTPIQAVAQAAPSNMDAVYQAAGAQYGVPWGVIKGLHAAESGYRDGPIYNGSGSGAYGPYQFMPGTWAAYHDPKHPNQASAVDGAYAAARYLAAHGNDVQALYAYGTNVSAVLNVAASTGSTY